MCLWNLNQKTHIEKVLERFQSKFPEIRPVAIMTDFETALRQVFIDTYPQAQVYSCWFHFVQVGNLKSIKRITGILYAIVQAVAFNIVVFLYKYVI